jgi:hypothetical protein
MARTFVEANRVEEPFTAILDSDAHRRRLQERKNTAHHDPLQLTLLDLELETAFYDGAITA